MNYRTLIQVTLRTLQRTPVLWAPSLVMADCGLLAALSGLSTR